MSIIRGLKFTTIEYILNRNKKSLINSINKIVNHYKSQGLTVQAMYANPGIDCLEENIPCINTAGARYHVPKVEQQVQVAKIHDNRVHFE